MRGLGLVLLFCFASVLSTMLVKSYKSARFAHYMSESEDPIEILDHGSGLCLHRGPFLVGLSFSGVIFGGTLSNVIRFSLHFVQFKDEVTSVLGETVATDCYYKKCDGKPTIVKLRPRNCYKCPAEVIPLDGLIPMLSEPTGLPTSALVKGLTQKRIDESKRIVRERFEIVQNQGKRKFRREWPYVERPYYEGVWEEGGNDSLNKIYDLILGQIESQKQFCLKGLESLSTH